MKKILITGADKGIGFATLKMFKESGYQIFALDKEFSNLKKQNNVQLIVFDLANTDMIKELKNKIGEIDILINNAGILNTCAYDNYPEEDKRRIIKINLEAPIELINTFSKDMIKNNSGRIISVSSLNGKIGHTDIWYGISKAGIINFTKSYAKILGGKGILVNCVAPGPVDTDMLKIAPLERVETFKNMSIEKRVATSDEIAKVIFWLATECPTYINGVCVDINNGIRL
jgi:3-oxoacyl-[acyl-carrier protein] reductase